ncbi:MAG: glycosyltransferase [Cellulophaga sp.]|nr:glycosyltransferase [Cellulophaga sp.]
MKFKNTPIVVVAYNRPRSLKRLLSSLEKGNYLSQEIPLIISIDKADSNEDVLAIANEFSWEFGVKEVNYQAENLGLRAHILQCGALSQKYGAVIVLEDDLYVAPNFYEFAIQALEFSEDKVYLGGISLYNHQYNVNVEDNFSPVEDGFDNWYFQFASSWGQAWTEQQWSKFMEWYNNRPSINENEKIPAFIRSWSEKSWLKYNISYLILENLYFLYPKISLTTNFSDAGTHIGQDSTLFQVPIDLSGLKTFQFSNLKESKAIYDAFYENTNLSEILGVESSELTIDLYGSKQNVKTKLWLSSKIVDFKIIQSFAKSLKPMDVNILEGIVGKELFLYDTSIVEVNRHAIDKKRNILYTIKLISYVDALYIVKSELIRKVRKLAKMFMGK